MAKCMLHTFPTDLIVLKTERMELAILAERISAPRSMKKVVTKKISLPKMEGLEGNFAFCQGKQMMM